MIKNKIKIISIFLICLNLMSIPAFADYTQSGTVNNGTKPVGKSLNGNLPKDDSSETSNPSSGGSSNTNPGKKQMLIIMQHLIGILEDKAILFTIMTAHLLIIYPMLLIALLIKVVVQQSFTEER